MATTKKSIRTLRNDLRTNLKAELATKVVLTPEIEAKVETKVIEKYPYQIDELNGYRTEVILTYEEIVAAAAAIGIIDPLLGQSVLNNITDTGFVEKPLFENGQGEPSARKGDITALSPIGDGARSSVVRRTSGTDWVKFGAVFLYRPLHERENKEQKSMVDDILGG